MSNGSQENLKDAIIDTTAGSLGGLALVYVGQPLDTVKVKMQTFPSMYKNMINCFMRTLREEGLIKGLYAGTMPALASNITENAVLFLCYGFCQKFIMKLTNKTDVKQLDTVSNASAGCLASFFSSVAITPPELVKCRLQALYELQKNQHTARTDLTAMKMTMAILKDEGPQGLFRGLIPTLVREMPGYFFFFGGYEGMREIFRSQHQCKEEIGLMKTMVSGAVGGLVFWGATYPVDVAKSRIQVNNSKENMFNVIWQMWRQEGFRSLYNGLTPTLIRTIPATATLFVTYEYSKKTLQEMFDK